MSSRGLNFNEDLLTGDAYSGAEALSGSRRLNFNKDLLTGDEYSGGGALSSRNIECQ